MAISKNRIKYIHSLRLKKNRKEKKVFLAEGPKLVMELLSEHLECHFVAATHEWLSHNRNLPAGEVAEVSDTELSKISLLETPQQVLAIFRIPDYGWDMTSLRSGLCLALDGVQDPGNLGTIIRLADWFGIKHIFCSPDTADAYNPKTIQATMGSIARVKVHYSCLTDLIRSLKEIPVYGTFLEGENIYSSQLSENGLIVMGNEGNGITPDVGKLITRRLHIPSYPMEQKTSESLNVAVATSIVCAEFRRRVLR